MSTIFDLNTSGQLPPVNQGMSEYRYDQKTAIRDVSGNNFQKGPIEFRYHVSGNQYYVPARSYIRARVTISKGNGNQLQRSDALAPAMNMFGNLFSSGSVLLHNKEISKIEDFMGEIDMLETRMSKSGPWMDKMGTTLRWLDVDLQDRIEDISFDGVQESTDSTTRVGLGYDAATNEIEIVAGVNNLGTAVFTIDGGAALPDLSTIWREGDILQTELANQYVVLDINAATNTLLLAGTTVAEAVDSNNFYRIRSLRSKKEVRRVHSFEVIWVPPFSINKLGHALPVGDYKLRLVPHSGNTYKTRAIESVVAKTANLGATVNDFEVSIDSMFYYVATMKGPRIEDKTYFLDLDETHVSTEDVTGNPSSQQKTFSVSENTYALSVAFASAAAGSDTRFSPSKFICGADFEKSINRLQVEYANQTKPNPIADPAFFVGASNNDFLEQRYGDTYLYNGMYFDEAGAESKDQWLNRGPYYYLPFPKDATSKDTRVIVRYGFEDALPADGARVLLFAHSKKMATIKIVNGRVESVNLADR